MQSLAAEVGYSETVFVTEPLEGRTATVRYFSPLAEVPFCGHATIALGVALAEQHGTGPFLLRTGAGPIAVGTTQNHLGEVTAALTSALPAQRAPAAGAVDAALVALGWSTGDLDERFTPAEAYAGAWHLVLVVASRRTLAALDYDYDALRTLCVEHGWVTVHLAWVESGSSHHVRSPFPYGGVREDPATGAGAAAYGAYLRDTGFLACPASFVVHQGQDMGRPCRIEVVVPAEGGVTVSGRAVAV